MKKNEFLIKLKVLGEILQNKKILLKNILNITLNQRTILSSKEYSSEGINYLNMMNKEKQNLIDRILKDDSVFERIFESLSSNFDYKANYYVEEIQNLQLLIASVTELDNSIRDEENTNNILHTQNPKFEKIETSLASKKFLLNKYRENNKSKI